MAISLTGGITRPTEPDSGFLMAPDNVEYASNIEGNTQSNNTFRGPG